MLCMLEKTQKLQKPKLCYHAKLASFLCPRQAQKLELAKFGYFSGIFRFFRVFSGTFLQTPKKTLFETFFGIFGPGGPGDSCKWSLGSQEKTVEITTEIAAICQKLGDHSNFRRNALGVKRPFSALLERSDLFSEQLSEFRK